MTTELRAEPGQAWLQPRRVPTPEVNWALEAPPSGRHRPHPERHTSYREVFAIAEFRALWTAQVLSFARSRRLIPGGPQMPVPDEESEHGEAETDQRRVNSEEMCR